MSRVQVEGERGLQSFVRLFPIRAKDNASCIEVWLKAVKEKEA